MPRSARRASLPWWGWILILGDKGARSLPSGCLPVASFLIRLLYFPDLSLTAHNVRAENTLGDHGRHLGPGVLVIRKITWHFMKDTQG